MNILWMIICISAAVFNFYVADSMRLMTEKMGRFLFVTNFVVGCMNLAAAIWYMVK